MLTSHNIDKYNVDTDYPLRVIRLLYFDIFPYVAGEYCDGETFHPICPQDKVIFITEAFLGRLQLGRCIPEDSGHLGCFTSLYTAMSRQCSGRHECEVRVADLSASSSTATSCPPDLEMYLHVSYECSEGKT